MQGIREIAVIWSAEFWRTLRSSRVVVLLLLYVMFTVMALLVVRGLSRSITTQIDAQVAQMRESGADPAAIQEKLDEGLKEARKKFVATFFSDDEAMTEALLVVPLLLLVVFKTTLRFLPLYTGIMGFDQISGEVGPRSIRYLTVRSRRSSVMFGKFLAQASILAILMFIIDLGLCLYGRLSQQDFTTGSMLMTLGKF